MHSFDSQLALLSLAAYSIAGYQLYLLTNWLPALHATYRSSPLRSMKLCMRAPLRTFLSRLLTPSPPSVCPQHPAHPAELPYLKTLALLSHRSLLSL